MRYVLTYIILSSIIIYYAFTLEIVREIALVVFVISSVYYLLYVINGAITMYKEYLKSKGITFKE